MYIAEPIGSAFLYYNFKLELLSGLLPMEGHWNLIPRPIERYALSEARYWVSTQSVVIALGQLAFYLTGIWLLLTKRDVK
jgi:hypothetical protein